MPSSHTEDSIDRFTLEILRAGYALTGLGAELSEAMAEEQPCDEPGGGAAVYEMISGSIREYLADADGAEVDHATHLICGAMDRVLEHLQLALELRTRMEGGPAGRGYDDPIVAADLEAVLGAEGRTGPAELVTGTSQPASGPTGELAEALVHCGGLLSQVVAQMMLWEGQSADGEVQIPDAACSLVAALLADLDAGFSDEDLALGTEIVEALAESLTRDVYFVEPDPDAPQA